MEIRNIKILIILLVLLLNMDELYSQRLSGFIIPHENSCWDKEIEINEKTDIDSLNNILSFMWEEYKSKVVSPWYPFINIIFNDMNENQIDYFIKNMNYKKHVFLIEFWQCTLEKLPYSFRDFEKLSAIGFHKCDSINSLNGYNSVNSIFGIYFDECRIKKLPDGIEKLKPMLRLILNFPDDYDECDLNIELQKFIKRNNILDLFVYYKLLKIFPDNLFNLSSIQTLIVANNNIKFYPPKFHKLVNLVDVMITTDGDNFFQSVDKIEGINSIGGGSFPENEDEKFKFMTEYITMDKGMIYKDDFGNIKQIGSITLYRFESKTPLNKKKHVINYKDYILNITQDTSNYKRINLRFSSLNLSDTITGELNYVANYELNYKLTFTKNECEIDFNKFKYNFFNIILQINDNKYSIRIDCEG